MMILLKKNLLCVKGSSPLLSPRRSSTNASPLGAADGFAGWMILRIMRMIMMIIIMMVEMIVIATWSCRWLCRLDDNDGGGGDYYHHLHREPGKLFLKNDG